MFKKILLLLTVAVLMMLNGCSHAPLSKDFKEATANNIAVQTINPKAGISENSHATLDGEKSEKALERYREDSGKTSSDTMLTNMKR